MNKEEFSDKYLSLSLRRARAVEESMRQNNEILAADAMNSFFAGNRKNKKEEET